MCKFPQVKIRLVGEDGNAFSIMGRAKQAARRAGVSQEDINAYLDEATSSGYDHLLWVTMEYFNCDQPDGENENV